MAGAESEADGRSAASAPLLRAADFPREALGPSLSCALFEALTGYEAERV
jgi:hypothetical protein